MANEKQNKTNKNEQPNDVCCPYCSGHCCFHPSCIRMRGFECACFENKKKER